MLLELKITSLEPDIATFGTQFWTLERLVLHFFSLDFSLLVQI